MLMCDVQYYSYHQATNMQNTYTFNVTPTHDTNPQTKTRTQTHRPPEK